MDARTKRWVSFGFLAVTPLLAAWWCRSARWLELLELKAFDAQMRTLPARPPEDVVLLVIDQLSLERYPEPVFLWHPRFATAITAAAGAGARVIGVDIAFAIPVERWAPGYDSAMANAFLEANAKSRVVCGIASPLATMQQQWPVPWNMICASAGAGAFVNLRADADDFIRTIELATGPPPVPSFALAVARAFKPGLAVPPGPVMRIRHAGPAGTVRRVSLSVFLDAVEHGEQARLESWVKGKAVLLGPDQISDRHATPYYSFRAGSSANTSGVEIHASAIDTLLTGEFLLDVPAGWQWLSPVLAALLLGAGAVFARGRLFALLACGALLSLVGVAHVLFRAGWVAPTAFWFVAWLLAFLFALAVRAGSAEQRGKLFRRAVTLFVGERAAEQMERAGHTAFAPHQEELTVLFTDIAGFTSFCESRTPDEVLATLNRYFEQLTAIVTRHGGQVNKLIGDGMLAIFTQDSARSESPAERATRAAIEIVARSEPFRTRAGLHTGPAVVGNVGSGDKLEYTVLGDTVNVASRLQALNKEKDTRILLSAATREAIGGRIALDYAGEVALRGKSAGMPVYTLGSEARSQTIE